MANKERHNINQIYPTEKTFESISSKIERLEGSNREHIQGFMDECLSDKLSKIRINKLVGTLLIISNMIDKPLDELTKEDVKRLVAKIEASDRAAWTKSDYMIVLKKFFKWLKKEDKPEITAWIKNKHTRNDRLPETILTEDEVQTLIQSCNNSRDRALVSILFDTGARIGELLNLQIKHLEIGNNEATMLIPRGKTGARRVLLIPSVPYLIKWLEDHPNKNDSEAWLWVKQDKTNDPIDYFCARKILVRLSEKSGIKKRIAPHQFRHAAATINSKYLTEAQMKERFGWVQSSEMASVYVHLSGRDVDASYKKRFGIVEKKEEDAGSKLMPIICQTCSTSNAVTSSYCYKCLRPLSLKVAMEERAVWNESDKIAKMIFDKMIESNKGFFEEIIQKVKADLQKSN